MAGKEREELRAAMEELEEQTAEDLDTLPPPPPSLDAAGSTTIAPAPAHPEWTAIEVRRTRTEKTEVEDAVNTLPLLDDAGPTTEEHAPFQNTDEPTEHDETAYAPTHERIPRNLLPRPPSALETKPMDDVLPKIMLDPASTEARKTNPGDPPEAPTRAPSPPPAPKKKKRPKVDLWTAEPQRMSSTEASVVRAQLPLLVTAEEAAAEERLREPAVVLEPPQPLAGVELEVAPDPQDSFDPAVGPTLESAQPPSEPWFARHPVLAVIIAALLTIVILFGTTWLFSQPEAERIEVIPIQER